MRNSSSYWLAAYIVSMITILAVVIASILDKAPDKTCPSSLNPPIGVSPAETQRVSPAGASSDRLGQRLIPLL